jgi:hypothetical protein
LVNDIVVDLHNEVVLMDQNAEIDFVNDSQVKLDLLLMIQVQMDHVEQMVEHLVLIMVVWKWVLKKLFKEKFFLC